MPDHDALDRLRAFRQSDITLIATSRGPWRVRKEGNSRSGEHLNACYAAGPAGARRSMVFAILGAGHRPSPCRQASRRVHRRRFFMLQPTRPACSRSSATTRHERTPGLRWTWPWMIRRGELRARTTTSTPQGERQRATPWRSRRRRLARGGHGAGPLRRRRLRELRARAERIRLRHWPRATTTTRARSTNPANHAARRADSWPTRFAPSCRRRRLAA